MVINITVAAVMVVVISYFIGNISPAILIGKMHGIDIKKEGSGNAGTTNALRVLGKKAAVATLVIDIVKGVIAVLLGKYFCGQEVALICGLAVFCGHIWPAIFKFKGGKGVATAFGVITAVHPLLGIAELTIVLVVVLITRRVSAGSLVGAVLFPFLAYVLSPGDISQIAFLSWSAAIAVIVIIKHRSNLVRLLKGEEPKLSFKKKEIRNE